MTAPQSDSFDYEEYNRREKHDILNRWLAAADAFCKARKPNLSTIMNETCIAPRFPRRNVFDEPIVNPGNTFDRSLMRIARESAALPPYSTRDTVDALYLRSGSLLREFSHSCYVILKECRLEGLIPDRDDAHRRSKAIEEAIERRRRQLGVKRLKIS
ncbi:MAG: hypothetical protein ABL907_05850 [Hyphomicrobium sp.]